MTEPTFELSVRVPSDIADAVTAWLFEGGAGGVEEREVDDHGFVTLVVYSTATAELDAIAEHVRAELGAQSDRGLPPVPFTLARRVVAVDWEAEWLRHVRVVPLADGFVAQPVGDSTPLPQGRRVIRFRPAWAFGDGTHPTTQLAAAAVEDVLRRRPGATVLDVGTGSGVLALLAALAGASRIRGIDVDPKAIAAARENVGLNPEAAFVELATTPLADVAESFDLVVANITETTLCELAPELARVTKSDGALVVTGIVAGDTWRLEQRLAAQGLTPVRVREQAEWVLLELARA
jgi:ribosomal protein L11 methyltransferase